MYIYINKDKIYMKTLVKNHLQQVLINSDFKKNSKAYRVVAELLDISNGQPTYMVHIQPDCTCVIHSCEYSGSGKKTKLNVYTPQIICILNYLEIQYEFYIDSPRGGRIGERIKILSEII